MLSRYRWTWAGLAFGMVLFVFAFGDMGMGEATSIPSAVFGAPLAIFVPLFPIPLWWLWMGGLLDRHRNGIALILLAIHTACAPAILIFGTPMEPGGLRSRYFDRMERFNPEFLWLGFGIYALGLYVAWRLAIQRSTNPAGSPTSTP